MPQAKKIRLISPEPRSDPNTFVTLILFLTSITSVHTSHFAVISPFRRC